MGQLSLSFGEAEMVDENSGNVSQAAGDAIGSGTSSAASKIKTGFSKALDQAMATSIWSWPRNTLRQNGSLAGYTRDIIDTGTLQRSLSSLISSSLGGSETMISFAYSAPYAKMVHYGGAMQPYGNRNAATVILPGRPWMQSAVEGSNGIPKFDFKSIYSKEIKAAWS
jgi:hypothetical protein